MDHLSSCYFCGTALDGQLQEYAVVPPALRDADDDVTTATLCSTCQRKLERVLDTFLAAAGGPSADETETDTGSGDDADEGTSGSGARDVLVDPDDAIDSPDEDDITAADVTAMAGEVDTDVAAEPEGRPGDETPAAAGNTEETTEPEGDDEEPEAQAADGEDEDGGEMGGDGEDEAAAADVPGGEGEEDGDSDETPGDGGRDDDAPEGGTEPLADSGTGAADASPADSPGSPEETETAEADETAEQAAEADDAPESAATDEEGDATPGARTTISALEYNKVMRLLQNREFPVDRAEIETVAANAYDLSRQECAAVIDLAVDRGLITETDGQLARPE